MTFAAETNATRQQSRLGGRTDTHRHTDVKRHNTFSARLSGGVCNKTLLLLLLLIGVIAESDNAAFSDR